MSTKTKTNKAKYFQAKLNPRWWVQIWQCMSCGHCFGLYKHMGDQCPKCNSTETLAMHVPGAPEIDHDDLN